MWSGFDNVEKNDQEKDYYQILGCTQNSSVDQIIAEYRVRALKSHPDKNPGEDSALLEFQKLQEARDILTDPEKRKEYDQWKKCGVSMTFQQWKYFNSRCKMTMHWATPKQNIMVEGTPAQGSNNTDDRKSNNSGQRGDVKWGNSCGQSWEPDNRRSVYNQFRSYDI